MPSLFDVANHFDDMPILDGYTSAYLYLGQFSTFMEAGPDGSTAQRRTLSLRPNLVIPTRSVISILGERWIVGQSNYDGIYGQAIRQSFWTKKALNQHNLLSPGNAALGVAGTAMYTHSQYLKDTVNVLSDSEYDPFWNIYISRSELVTKGSFLVENGKYFRVRSLHLATDGLTNASCDELDSGCRVGVAFTGLGAYSPVTESHTQLGAPVAVPVEWQAAFGETTSTDQRVYTYGIQLDRTKLFYGYTEADKTHKAGDLTLLVATSAITPTVGGIVQIGPQKWQILDKTTDADAWVLHIRRA